MPTYSKDGRTVFFIHIPKTGGSSLEKAFVDNGWADMISYGSITRGQQHDRRPTWKRHVSDNTEKVTIVRNPITRLLSEMRGAQDYRDLIKPWDANKCIDYMFELLKRGNHKWGHLCKITEYIDPEKLEQENITVFKFEDPDHRSKIIDKYGFTESYPHIVGGTYAPDLDYSLSEESISKIINHYYDDFKYFYPELLK